MERFLARPRARRPPRRSRLTSAALTLRPRSRPASTPSATPTSARAPAGRSSTSPPPASTAAPGCCSFAPRHAPAGTFLDGAVGDRRRAPRPPARSSIVNDRADIARLAGAGGRARRPGRSGARAGPHDRRTRARSSGCRRTRPSSSSAALRRAGRLRRRSDRSSGPRRRRPATSRRPRARCRGPPAIARRARAALPLVAIGGITLENARARCIDAGARLGRRHLRSRSTAGDPAARVRAVPARAQIIARQRPVTSISSCRRV